MSRISGCLVLMLLALCWVVSAQSTGAVDCKKVVAQGVSGGKHSFNFAALQSASTTPLKVADKSGQWEYEFAVCNNFACDGSPAAVCQEASNNNVYPCGVGFTSSTPAVWTKKSTFFPKGAVTFTLAPTGTTPRGATISVLCDPKSSSPGNFSVISAAPGSQPPYIYQIFLSHKSACVGGISGGSICLIIFFVGFALYFLCGFIFLKFVRKNEGIKECIPNYEFWADLPSLMKDGWMFIYGKICGRSSNYENVA